MLTPVPQSPQAAAERLLLRLTCTAAPQALEPDALFMRVREAALMLRVCERTIYRWLRAGTLSGRRKGRTWLIPLSEITALLTEAQERAS